MIIPTERLPWFDVIRNALQNLPEGCVRSADDMILCRTESAVNAIAYMIKALYNDHGEEVTIATGSYDSDWWYMYLVWRREKKL